MKTDDAECGKLNEIISLYIKDPEKLKERLKNGEANLLDTNRNEHNKDITIIKHISEEIPRAAKYLEEIFDHYMVKGNDDSTFEIDFGILLPRKQTGKKNESQNDMKVLIALINELKRHHYNQSILLHPLIESFLHIKWTKLKYFYYGWVVLYAFFVFIMSWTILRIYKSTPDPKSDWISRLLTILILAMIIFEFIIYGVISKHQHIYVCLKRPICLMSFTSKALMSAVLILMHTGNDTDALKTLTVITSLLSWVEIVIMISHIPGCGNMYQMFTIVVTRAIKVFLLFGGFIIIGISMALWIITYDSKLFPNYGEAVLGTIIMINELDFTSKHDGVINKPMYVMFAIIMVLFVFFVPVVMMNYILALIIRDVESLFRKGQQESVKNGITVLDTISAFLSVFKRSKPMLRSVTMDMKFKKTGIFPPQLEEKIIQKYESIMEKK